MPKGPSSVLAISSDDPLAVDRGHVLQISISVDHYKAQIENLQVDQLICGGSIYQEYEDSEWGHVRN